MGKQVAARFKNQIILIGLIAQPVRAHADKREVGGSSPLKPITQKGNARSDWLIEINTEQK